ncbi:MAG: tRNA lysidine(34) synthetase TilS [Candidatus Meridianibacter frigidus]|nr:MAG: tRNA lysidine(34) synthetase TilS [Candidatus Eremiobacteraeota bacterium]
MRGAKPQRALELSLQRDSLFTAGQGVLIACSGGADSVALAAAAAAVAPALRLTICLAHVNHGLRESAWQDEAVVLALGATLRVPVDVAAFPGRRRGEAALRASRYGALLEIAARRGAASVATAHTAEDQTETVLLALFRGSGPQGLAGMPASRVLGPGVQLLRPLLRYDHEALRSYCHALCLPYALDPSNADLTYRRNAVRSALNVLRPFFPGLDRAAARGAGLCADEMQAAPRALLRARLRAILRENDALADVDFEHIEAAVRALERNASGRFSMNSSVELRVDRGAVSLQRRRGETVRAEENV